MNSSSSRQESDFLGARSIPAAAYCGRLHEQFVVDVVQGCAGPSTNMNANEVIANRALDLMGQARGSHHMLHPNDHPNASQSTSRLAE